MGILYSYCKKCDECHKHFSLEGFNCSYCNTYNTQDDKVKSCFNPEYFPKQREKEKRLEKIKKLLDE